VFESAVVVLCADVWVDGCGGVCGSGVEIVGVDGVLGEIVEEGGGWRRNAREAIRWIDQFATDLQQEKVRFYNQMKGKT
jgi:hypothetical protein